MPADDEVAPRERIQLVVGHVHAGPVTRTKGTNMTTQHLRKRVAIVVSIVGAVAAGALTASGQTSSNRPDVPAAGQAVVTAGLSQRYTACIRAGGATWTPIANSGGMYRVDIPAEANASCAGLELAREAAGQGDFATAAWLARIEGAPGAFWACVGAAGFHTPAGAGQRSDYASAAFGETARGCAVATGVTLPSR